MNDLFTNKRILIIGGTGSLGKALLKRILSFNNGKPKSVTVFSRDEAKQHYLRLEYLNKSSVTDEIIYKDAYSLLKFIIGDVRCYQSIVLALKNQDIVINAAALKQVPACEYYPYEAVRTNILGAQNIVQAIVEYNLPIETVVGISTDKAVKPVNVMGMSKSIQERIFSTANLASNHTRFVIARYGNVLASRGSVIPLFHNQILNGGPVTITSSEMTRFLLSLDEAVDVVLYALKFALPGEIFIPIISSARIIDIAKILIAEKNIPIQVSGIRPGEKIHEILVSEEESHRVRFLEELGKKYYIITPILKELSEGTSFSFLKGEYSSAHDLLSTDGIYNLLASKNLLVNNKEHIHSYEEMLK